MLGTPNNIASKATLLAPKDSPPRRSSPQFLLPLLFPSHGRRNDSFGEVQGTDITVIYH